jgi:TRAP-type mannitol/chloroaromatic compound transport system substrate-binding protein
MRKKMIWGCISVVILLGIFFIPFASAQQPIRWKAQSLFGAVELPYKAFSDFCDRVKVATNGRLEIKPYPAGAIVPTYEKLDALKNNIIQGMHTCASNFMAKDPALGIITDLNYGYQEPWEFEAWWLYRGGLDLLNELYKPFGVTAVGITFWGVESFPCKYPIRGVKDYQGKKFRAPQTMTADILAKVGAAVVILPGGEVFSALDKGVVDGADWGTPSMNQRMGFDKVAKYTIYPEYRSLPAAEFAVNTKEWEKLPADIKQILKSAVREFSQDMLARVAIDDLRALREMKTTGVTPIPWEASEVEKMRGVAQQVWEEWAKKSPNCRKVVDSNVQWLKELGRIK